MAGVHGGSCRGDGNAGVSQPSPALEHNHHRERSCCLPCFAFLVLRRGARGPCAVPTGL